MLVETIIFPYISLFLYVYLTLMFLYAFKVQLDQGEWGSDLPSVESHLENHRNVHKAIEEFQMSIKEAKMSEVGFN